MRYVTKETLNQLDDLVIRLGAEFDSAEDFIHKLMTIPESKPGSSFSRHMRAIETATHGIFVGGRASQLRTRDSNSPFTPEGHATGHAT